MIPFEEIRAGLEKYTQEIEKRMNELEKEMSKVEKKMHEVEPHVEHVSTLIKYHLGIYITEKICNICGEVYVAKYHKGTIPYACKKCTERILAIHKELIAKGFAFKHGFEKAVESNE